jgi:hypothetical protein
MEITTERVTPAKAEKMLNLNKGNRKLRPGVAEKYAKDMLSGQWTKCPTPISFYADGDIADGQHRLWAVIESGTTQTFFIVRGLSRADGLNIDTGLSRSVVDNARISGVDTDLSLTMIAVARGMREGAGANGTMSNAMKIHMVNSVREAAQFAVSFGPRGKGLRNAVVLSAFGRAWYHEPDKDRLRRFGEVMGSGFADGESESAAIAFRNYMMSKGASASTGGNWRDSFMKAQNAIWYFMRGKSLMTIKTVSDEAYPMDGKPRPPSGSNRVKQGHVVRLARQAMK